VITDQIALRKSLRANAMHQQKRMRRRQIGIDLRRWCVCKGHAAPPAWLETYGQVVPLLVINGRPPRKGGLPQSTSIAGADGVPSRIIVFSGNCKAGRSIGTLHGHPNPWSIWVVLHLEIRIVPRLVGWRLRWSWRLSRRPSRFFRAATFSSGSGVAYRLVRNPQARRCFCVWRVLAVARAKHCCGNGRQEH
jgi:hypothetical protein